MKFLLTFMVLTVALLSHAEDDLWKKFIEPSAQTHTKVWWFHGETETTEEGIDADLEAFHEAGIGGVVYYDQVHGNADGAFDAMSPEWWHMLKHAARKAQDLGLSFEIAASNGYVAGGPWITPDLGMQKIAVIDTVLTVESSQSLHINLSHPDPFFQPVATLIFPDSSCFRNLTLEPSSCTLFDNEEAILTFDAGEFIDICAINYKVNPRGKGSTGSMNIPGAPQDHYFGALYTELPPIGTLEYSNDGQTWMEAVKMPAIESVIGHKSPERTVSFPTVRGRWFRVRVHDWIDDEGKFNKLQIENVQISTRDLIDNWQVKSGLRTEVTYPHPEGGNQGAICKSCIHNVTQLTDEDGKLHINLEPGCWHILRFGHIPTYGRTKHGRRNLLGLEADVMSAKAATIHYENYFKTIYDTLSADGCKVEGLCMDSHEAGIQNWTSGFEKRFLERNGYDLIPWLPVLAGYIVTDRSESERILHDFRHTIAETIASEFYGTFAKLCREDNVTFTSQGMINIINDNIFSRSKADKPQGEFWSYQTDGNYDCLDAVSAAHLYGQPIASAEAFTDTPYSTTWDELLRIANLAYCRGINEFAVCASSFQPWNDHKYDDSDSAHPYIFHRHNPAWSSIGPFWEYQSRCASLLREGKPIVDLCIFIGEDLPAKTFAYKLPIVPEGFNFDICTYDALINRFSAYEGKLAVEGGMSYRALVIQDRSHISPQVIKKIEDLAAAGVPVIRCDLGEEIGERLEAFGINPDVAIHYNRENSTQIANKTEDRLCFFHRQTPNSDIYFLYNHCLEPFEGLITFRSSYNKTEMWNPLTGSRRSIPMDINKTLQIPLKPYESTFVVVQ